METISNQMQAWFTSGRLLPSIGYRRRFAGQQHPVLTKHLHIPTSSSERMAGDCLSSSSHALSSQTFLRVSLWRPRVVKDADDLFHQQSRHVGCGGSGQVTTCSVSKGSHVCWSSCFRQVKPLVWPVCPLDGCETGYSDQPKPDEFDGLLFHFYASVVCMTYSCAGWWGKLFDLCWPGSQIHLTYSAQDNDFIISWNHAQLSWMLECFSTRVCDIYIHHHSVHPFIHLSTCLSILLFIPGFLKFVYKLTPSWKPWI